MRAAGQVCTLPSLTVGNGKEEGSGQVEDLWVGHARRTGVFEMAVPSGSGKGFGFF